MPDEIDNALDSLIASKRPVRTAPRGKVFSITNEGDSSSWGLHRLPEIETEYQKRVGKPIPYGRKGQGSGVGGWAHHENADVDLTPGTPEANTLEEILRERNIPFRATPLKGIQRNAQGRTISTGDHYHLGPPSGSRRAPQREPDDIDAALDELISSKATPAPTKPTVTRNPMAYVPGSNLARKRTQPAPVSPANVMSRIPGMNVLQAAPPRTPNIPGLAVAQGRRPAPTALEAVSRTTRGVAEPVMSDEQKIKYALREKVRPEVEREMRQTYAADSRDNTARVAATATNQVPVMEEVERWVNDMLPGGMTREQIMKLPVDEGLLSDLRGMRSGVVGNRVRSMSRGALSGTASLNESLANLITPLTWVEKLAALATNTEGPVTGLQKDLRSRSELQRNAVLRDAIEQAEQDGIPLGDMVGEGGVAGAYKLLELGTVGKLSGLKAGPLMSLTSGVSAADKGVEETAKALGEGYIRGRALSLTDPYSRPVNMALQGGGAGLETLLRTGDPKQAASEAITQGGMGALQGQGRRRLLDDALKLIRRPQAEPVEAAPAEVAPTVEPDLPAITSRLRSELARRAPVVEPQQPLQAPVATETPVTTPKVAEYDTVRRSRQYPKTPETPQPAKFQHLTFGEVTAVENQAGVGRGKVRVVDADGAEHTIQRASGNGRGNNLAIPVKEAPVETAEVRAAFEQFQRRAEPVEPWEMTRDYPELARGKDVTQGKEVTPEQARTEAEQRAVPASMVRTRPSVAAEARGSVGKANTSSPEITPAQRAAEYATVDRELATERRKNPRNKDFMTAEERAAVLARTGMLGDEAPAKVVEQRTSASVARQDQRTNLSPKEVIEAAGLKYKGEQEMPKGKPPGHMFDMPDGSTLMIKGEVTPESVAAKLKEHQAKSQGRGQQTTVAVPAAQTKAVAPEAFTNVDPKAVQVGDVVRTRSDKRTAGLTGTIKSIGRVNVKVEAKFTMAPGGPEFTQLHTIPKHEIAEARRVKSSEPERITRPKVTKEALTRVPRAVQESGKGEQNTFGRSDGSVVVIAKSTKHANKVQLTEFSPQGEPLRDATHNNTQEALSDARARGYREPIVSSEFSNRISGKPRTIEPSTPHASVKLGASGGAESFEIATPEGAKVTGYVRNSDFPNQGSRPTRGELFYTEVPKTRQRQGLGTSLAKDALRLLWANGAKTVNMNGTTESGRALIKTLQREGFIGQAIKTSESGKSEFSIRERALESTTSAQPVAAKVIKGVPSEVLEQHRASFKGGMYDFGYGDSQQGSPKGLETLRSWDTPRLQAERNDMVKASFGLHGQNAKDALHLIDKVLGERAIIKRAAQPRRSVRKEPSVEDKISSVSKLSRLTEAERTQHAQAKANIKAKLSKLKASDPWGLGIVADLAPDLIVVGKSHIKNGYRTFDAWSVKVIEDLGENVKPYLEKIWKAAGGQENVAKTPERVSPRRMEPVEGVNWERAVRESSKAGGESKPVEAKGAEVSTTSARKAQFAQDRQDLDLPELPKPERKAWQTTLDNAKEKGIPERASAIADEVLNKPRALNDEETAGLVLRAQQIKNEHSKTLKEIGEATEPEVISTKKAQLDALEAEFDKLTTATKRSGTEKGRALASQKLTINQDYDLVSVVQRAKAAKGDELTPKARAKFEELAKKLEETEGRLTKSEEAYRKLEASKSVKRLVDDATRERRKAGRVATRQELDTEFAQLSTQFSARLESRLNAGIDPELVVIIGKMAKNRVHAGINTVEGLVAEIHGRLKDYAEERDIRDAISGYGKTAEMSKDAINVQLRELKRQMRLVSAIEDAESGQRPARSGLIRESEGTKAKELRKQLNATLKEQGLTPPREADPVAAQGRLRAKIEELDAKIKAGDLSKTTRAKREVTDPATQAYIAERNLLQKNLNEMRRAAKPVTERDPLPAVKTRLVKQIAELEGKIKAGDFTRPPKRVPMALDTVTKRLIVERDLLKQTIDREIQNQEKTSKLDALTAFRRANLLSAFKTHVRNFTANVAFQVSEEVSRPAAAFADMIAKHKTGQRSTFGISLPAVTRAAIKAAITEGPARMKDIMLGREVLPLEGRENARESTSSKMQLPRLNSGSKLLDFYVNTVFNTMQAGDAPFKVFAFRRELADIAKAQARSEGKGRARARELQHNPTDAMVIEAAAYADYATFQNKNVVSSAIASGKRELSRLGGFGRAGKFAIESIAPFDRTPTNIIYRTFEYSPLGFISAARKYRQIGKRAAAEKVANELFTREEQKAFARTFGRASTGTILSALGMALAAKALLTGAVSYEDDKADYMKKRREAGGGGMVHVPGTDLRISITDTPIGKGMATAAAMWEEMAGTDKEGKPLPMDTRLSGAAKSLGRVALDQPLVKGTEELLQGSLGNRIGNYARSYIPGSSMLESINEVADPNARKFRYNKDDNASFLDNVLLPLQRTVPGLRRGIPVDASREPEERGNVLRRTVRAFDPFNTTTEGMGPKNAKKGKGTPRVATRKAPSAPRPQ